MFCGSAGCNVLNEGAGEKFMPSNNGLLSGLRPGGSPASRQTRVGSGGAALPEDLMPESNIT